MSGRRGGREHGASVRRPALPRVLRSQWRATYQKSDYRRLPWFSPHPSPWVRRVVEEGWFRPGTRVLDVGCGAGTNLLHLARSGLRASGIDLAEGAIEAARERARRQGLDVDARVADVLRLPYEDGTFGGAIDIGCFHTLPPALRRAYARELHRVLRPGATHALSWIGREAAELRGPPHRPSLEEVTAALEDEFLFLRTEFDDRRPGRLSAYHAILERRKRPRPPRR